MRLNEQIKRTESRIKIETDKIAELTKQRIQQIWDYELISLWDEKGKNKMWKVVHNFLCKVKGEHKIGDVSFEDAEDYLVSLQLKRCLDINHQLGMHVFRAWKTDVIGFIHARSIGLSMALINEDAKPLILLDISKYKWIKKNTNAAAKFRRNQRSEKKRDQANLKIRARDLDNNNWDKVG